jgi:hypothetical protein
MQAGVTCTGPISANFARPLPHLPFRASPPQSISDPKMMANFHLSYFIFSARNAVYYGPFKFCVLVLPFLICSKIKVPYLAGKSGVQSRRADETLHLLHQILPLRCTYLPFNIAIWYMTSTLATGLASCHPSIQCMVIENRRLWGIDI